MLLEVKDGVHTGQADGYRIGGHLNSKIEHHMEGIVYDCHGSTHMGFLMAASKTIIQL